jgi:hypothetical protein
MSSPTPDYACLSLDGADERRFLVLWLQCTRERPLPTKLCRRLRRNFERVVSRGLPARVPRRFRGIVP